MKFINRIRTMLLLMVLLLAGCSEKGKETKPQESPVATQGQENPGQESTEKPTPTPEGTQKKEYAGKLLAPGLFDVSGNIQAILPEGYRLYDAMFWKDDIMLVVADNGENSVIALYGCEKGELIASCRTDDSIAVMNRYASSGLVVPGDEEIALISLFQKEVILFNGKLEETGRVSYALPEISTMPYGGIHIGYSFPQKAVFYSEISEPNSIFRANPKEEMPQLIYRDEDPNACLTFQSSTDGQYLEIKSYDYMSWDTRERDCVLMYYLVNAKTGEMEDSSWLPTTYYAANGQKAWSRYDDYLSYAAWGDRRISADYLEEYQYSQLFFDTGCLCTVVTQENVCGSNRIFFSAYDFADGERRKRVAVEFPGGCMFRENNAFLNRPNSNGGSCVEMTVKTRDTEEDEYQVTILLWDMEESTNMELNDDSGLRKCCSDEPARVVTREGIDALIRHLEETYDIGILTGRSGEQYVKERIDGYDCRFLRDGWDIEYEYECVRFLEGLLSEYTPGMFKKLSGSYAGRLSFVFVTGITDKNDVNSSLLGFFQNIRTQQGQTIALRTNPGVVGELNFRKGGLAGTAHHEICHAIQAQIMENVDGKTLLDLDKWLAFYPEGYKNGKTDEEILRDYLYGGDENRYFLDEYSLRSILEDMSRLFEFASRDEPSELLQLPNIYPRYHYLCEVISEYFGDTMPEGTVRWERSLAE